MRLPSPFQLLKCIAKIRSVPVLQTSTSALQTSTLRKQKRGPIKIRPLSMSGKRDSNSRPQPWQGCALPTELFPQLPNLKSVCPEQDSNLHASRHTHLKRARLPIPPPGHLLFIDRDTDGAKNGTRTRDPNLGKVVLYQLSYFRNCECKDKRTFRFMQALRRFFHQTFFKKLIIV